MKKINLNRGIAPLVIVLIVVVALAIGGGAYYSSKKAPMQVEENANINVDANVQTNVPTTGSLRSLFALGGDMVCTVDGPSSGTVYISGGMMRGDFTTTGAASGSVESHMIRQDDTMYVWQGSQGAKMSMSGNASAQTQNSVDLDSNVNYQCENWSKDDSKFTPPSTVNFIDLQAMMNASGGVKIPKDQI